MTQNIEQAIVIGATGLVGLNLIQQLQQLPSCSKILAVVRKHNVQLDQYDKVQQLELDDFLLLNHEDVQGYSHAFSCLGTTLKKAGSKEQFYAIDYVVNAHFAELFVLSKTHYVLISALGAQANSKIFYNRVKGELEETIRGLDLYKVSILQPSLLIGQRNEGRMLEDIFQKAYTKLSHFIPKHFKYKPVTAEQVAHTMVEAAQTQTEKFEIYDNLRIQKTK